MPVEHRYGNARVDLSDIDDAIILRVQASDGLLVGARLPAEAATRLGGELQLAAAQVIGRAHAGRTDIMHLATECYDCGQPFVVTLR